uniref:RING-type domain-containing protein n=2 Tax=Ditylenchus dipsaci TaxID=166011 RepID=A0A915EQ83_9BILA
MNSSACSSNKTSAKCCSICFENLDREQMSALVCGHTFHRLCIDGWFKIYKDFSNEGVVVKFAAPKAVLMRMFRNTDFMDVVPPFEIFSTVRQAVQSTNANQRKLPLSHSIVEPKSWLESGKIVEKIPEEAEEEDIQLMLKHDFATETKSKNSQF